MVICGVEIKYNGLIYIVYWKIKNIDGNKNEITHVLDGSQFFYVNIPLQAIQTIKCP